MRLTYDFATGDILTPSGRVLDNQPTFTQAALAYEAVFNYINPPF